jgi:hypothetical protein
MTTPAGLLAAAAGPGRQPVVIYPAPLIRWGDALQAEVS